MFYCNECAKKFKWPETGSKSGGKCEMCNQVKLCNNRASSLLPTPPDPKFNPRNLCNICNNSKEIITSTARQMGYTFGPDEKENTLEETIISCPKCSI